MDHGPSCLGCCRRILLSDYDELLWLHRLGAVGVTAIVGVLAFLLGKFNYLFLICADFDLSGNQPLHTVLTECCCTTCETAI
ncbi:hypothetical protein ACWDSD_19640 [Streptomyces spiralis]